MTKAERTQSIIDLCCISEWNSIRAVSSSLDRVYEAMSADTIVSTVRPEEKAKTPAERERILRGLEHKAWLRTFDFDDEAI